MSEISQKTTKTNSFFFFFADIYIELDKTYANTDYTVCDISKHTVYYTVLGICVIDQEIDMITENNRLLTL